MSNIKPNKRPAVSRLPLYLGVAALALGAGFGAVYVNTAPQGNRGVPAPEVGSRNAEGPARGRYAALSKGEMTSFVSRSEPQDVAKITFKDAGGTARTLDDWKGRVVLINLWATWCAPCRKEMPSLDRLQAQLGSDNFEVVAISIDKVGPEAPRAFLEKISAGSLKFYHDETGRIGSTLKAFGMPTTLLIDRDGREIGRLTGPAEWDSPDAIALLKAALDG